MNEMGMGLAWDVNRAAVIVEIETISFLSSHFYDISLMVLLYWRDMLVCVYFYKSINSAFSSEQNDSCKGKEACPTRQRGSYPT